MIRKLRTQRDDQQWMLDLALNMRGRVQNFEGDFRDVPKRARNYRMMPKVWREAAEKHEALARRAHARGDRATATEHYDHAIEAYRSAQHPIFYDDHPVKKHLYRKLDENPELQDSVQAMADFYDNLQGSATAAFKAIDDEQLLLYSLDSNVVTQLQENQVLIDDLMALVKGVLLPN